MTPQCWEGNSPQMWVRAVELLPSEPLKFSINAARDILPTKLNLHKWGKKVHACDICPLCSSSQSLPRVLNNYPTAMDLQRYNRRHDKVLEMLRGFIQDHLNPSFSFTIGLRQHHTPFLSKQTGDLTLCGGVM